MESQNGQEKSKTMITEKRILVVDDEQRNRNLLQAMLKSLGYPSEVACDGTEALDRLHKDLDLILLDVMMPGMDGFEVTRRIRNNPDWIDIPIVMVTVPDKQTTPIGSSRSRCERFYFQAD